MKRDYPINPQFQQVKGIFVFDETDGTSARAMELMKSLRCEVTATYENRVTVRTSRGNLQSIKQSWLNADEPGPVSRELGACIRQIIIGGNTQ